VARCCKHGNEASNSIKIEKFIDCQSDSGIR
jgi:hypothetical protein